MVTSTATTIQLEWEPAFEDGGSPITEYQLYYDEVEGVGVANSENWVLALNGNQLSHTLTSLNSTKLYKFRVRAKSGAVVAGDYSPISQYYSASLPDKIILDTASTKQEGENITLHWTAPVIDPLTQLEILGYYVYYTERYTSNGNVLSYKMIETQNVEYLIENLTPGLEYEFKVSAYNAVGEGEKSDSHYAYAMTKPGTPEAPIRIFTSTLSNDEDIELSWNPVSEFGNVPITGYKLYQKDTVTDLETVAFDGTGSATTLTYIVTGLVLDRDYKFWVTALNTLESDPSEAITVRAAALPSAPGAITEVSRTSQSLELSWVASADNGGSAILAYTLIEEVYNEATGEITDQVVYFGSSLTSLVDNLVPGNTYIYKVKCTNMVGESEYSDSYSFKIVSEPSAPINIQVDSFSESQIVISWGAPLDHGKTSLSGYKVYRQTLSDSTSTMTLLNTLSSSVLTYTDAAVTSGTKYAYAVTATNSFKEGDRSSIIQARTIAAPSGMTAPLLVGSTSTSITVSWSPPTSDGSADVEYYSLMMKPEYENTYSEIYRGLSTFYTISGLDCGFTYLFKVQSVNEAGQSELSASSNAIYAAEEPGIPQNLQLVSRSDSQIKIEWEAPETTGGLPITGYKVYKAEGSGVYAEDTSAPSKTDEGIKEYELTSATAGSLYSFKISAVNPIGESLVSNPIKIIAADLPNKPANAPTITSYSTTSVTISLTTIPLASNGGSEITGYVVMIDNGLGDDDSFEIISDSLQTSLTVNGLTAGRTYRVKYAGRNVVYDSGNMFDGDELLYSEISTFTTAVDPEKPQNLRQSSKCYRTSIQIEWDEPSSSGGSPITEYVISYTSSTTVTISVSNTLTHTITNLIPGTKYEINIKAVTAYGNSGFLNEPIEAYPGVVPTSPGVVSFSSVTRNSIVVDWSLITNEDTGGTSADPISISSYNLYMKKQSEDSYTLVAQTTSNTYTVNYIKSGILYDFILSATNIIGESSMSSSNQMMAGTSPSSPGKPSVDVLFPTEVLITWTEPFDCGGSAITSYTLTVTKIFDSSVLTFNVIDALEFEFNAAQGVEAGFIYNVKVVANNYVTDYFAANTGADSAFTSFSTSVLPTTVPTLSSSSITRSSATVSWTLTLTDEQKGYSTSDPVYILEADDGEGGEFSVINSSPTDTSKALTGITPGTLLRLRMRVQNVVGYSDYGEILEIKFAEVPGTPDAPIFIERSGDTTNNLSPYITINWTAPSDLGGSEILGYKVEIQENAGAWNEALIGSHHDIFTWRFEGLNAGVPYNFRVYARNQVGYSSASSSTLIYCGTVPYAMTESPVLSSVTLSGLTSDVTVTWTAIDSSLNGGSTVLGYYLQTNSGFDTDFIEPGQQILSSNPLTYTFTGLTQGAKYKFKIAAYNEIYTTNPLGSTLNFSPVLEVIAAIAPEKVASLTQDKNALETGTVRMEWSEAVDNGSPITEYILYKDNGLGVFYEIYRGLDLNCTDTGLSPGGSYTYKVAAVNAAGQSIESDLLVGIAGELPSAPLNVRVTIQSTTQIKIEWDAPEDDGGLAITKYILNEDIAGTFQPDMDVNVLEYTKSLSSGDEGKTFSFRVAAYNQLGKGEYAADINVVAADAPDAPSMVLESREMNSLNIKFIPGASDGDSPLTGYLLYRNEGISGSPYKLIANVSEEQILFNVTDLVAGREYEFRLFSTNAAHTSTNTDDSWIVGAAPGKANDPSLKSSTKGTAGTGTITITWEDLESVPGLPLTNYLIYIDNQGDGNFGTAVNHTNFSLLEHQFTGLAEGAEYGIKIQAENVINTGEESNVVSLAAVSLPDAPAAPVFETSTNTSISLAWSAPTENGGTSITGYKVYMNDFTTDAFSLIYDGSSSPSVLSLTQQGLTAGNYYRFTVSALNRVGESPQSTSATFYCADNPGAPGAPELVSSATTSVTFKWTPPTDTGGGVIQNYEIYHKRVTESESSWTLLHTTPDINTLEYTHSPITGTDDVQYKIRAKSDERSEGSFSARSTFILASVPTMSTAPTIEATTKDSITVSWVLTSDGGSLVLGYKLYRFNKALGGSVLAYDGSSNAVVTSFVDENLSSGINYGYKVEAINRVGTSDLSPETVATTGEKPGKPPAPTYVSSTTSTITLSFDPVVETGGLPLVRYHLFRDNGTLDTNFEEINSYLGSDTEFVIDQSVETTMVLGRSYRFYITAENTLDQGPASDLTTVALGSLPSEPSSPQLNRDLSTQESLYVFWTALTAQDLDVEGYGLYMSATGEGNDFELVYDGFSQPDTYAVNITGLSTGKYYSFYLVAKNANGYSNPSNEARWLVCTPPSGLDPPVFSSATANSISLEWSEPDNDGGCPITTYGLFYYNTVTTAFEEVDQSGIQNKPYITSWTVTGLTDLGDPHLFKLTVANEIDTIESDTVSIILAAVPDTPTSIPTQDYDAAGKTQIGVVISGLTSGQNGGSDILGYQIYRDNGEGGEFTAIYDQESVLATSYLDTGLINGLTYRYKWRARNINGWSKFSDVGYLVAADVPGQPPAPSLTSVDDTQISISLSSPSDTGGDKITNYELFHDGGDINTAFTSLGSFSGSTGTHTLSAGLTPGKIYRIRWRVKSDIGYSEVSEALRVGFGNQAETVTNLALDIDKSGPGIMAVTWDKANDGLLPILGYTLQIRQGTDTFETIYAGQSDSDTISYIAEGLKEGEYYELRVYSHNFNGESLSSTILGAYACGKPSDFSAPRLVSTKSTSITIGWDPPANEGG